MIDILHLALPYFSLIFIGFACAKVRPLPVAGLAWMNFFLLDVSLPALLYGIISKTRFEELNNPPFLIATTCAHRRDVASTNWPTCISLKIVSEPVAPAAMTAPTPRAWRCGEAGRSRRSNATRPPAATGSARTR